MPERQRGIYVITNTITGETYIGKSIDIEVRWKIHRSELRAGKHINHAFQEAWDKDGESSFTFSVVELVDENENLGRLEREHFHQRYAQTGSHGYNHPLTTGQTVTDRINAREEARRSLLSQIREACQEAYEDDLYALLEQKITVAQLADAAGRSVSRRIQMSIDMGMWDSKGSRDASIAEFVVRYLILMQITGDSMDITEMLEDVPDASAQS